MLGGIFFSCGIFDSKSDEITKLYVTLQQLDQVAIYDTPELVLLKIIDSKIWLSFLQGLGCIYIV